MAAPLVVPFNFNPVSTTIKTASYEIPSGQYALITPFGNNLLELNGVVWGEEVIITTNNTVVSGSPKTLTFPNPYYNFGYFTWSMAGSGTDTFSATGITSTGRANGSTNSGSEYFDFVGDEWTITSSTTDVTTFSITSWIINQSPFWAKAGDVINGNNFGVTLYNQIT